MAGESIDESKLCYIDNCMFYLERALSWHLKENYNIIFELLDTDNDELFYTIYYTCVLINDKTFYFNFIEYLDDDGEPYNLIYNHNNVEYVGGSVIFDKIIDILIHDLIIHEINQIDTELKDFEKYTKKYTFELSTMAYLYSSAFEYKLPLDIVLKLI